MPILIYACELNPDEELRFEYDYADDRNAGRITRQHNSKSSTYSRSESYFPLARVDEVRSQKYKNDISP